MAAPDLPEYFGNYALGKNFVELPSPESISWLPQTPGWWIIGAVIVLWLLRLGWRRAAQWYRDRYRREAARRLAQLHQKRGKDWLLELNKLLKITALAGYSREKVARLSGLEWVEFLNAECAEPLFIADMKSCLADNLYAEHNPEDELKSDLLAAAARWINEHRGGADV